MTATKKALRKRNARASAGVAEAFAHDYIFLRATALDGRSLSSKANGAPGLSLGISPERSGGHER